MGTRLRRGGAAALAMTALTWAACGGSNEKQATAPPSATASQPSAAPPASAPPEPAKPAETAQTPEEPPPDDGAIAAMLKPWTGDLDGMVERRYIRMLVTFSKTN